MSTLTDDQLLDEVRIRFHQQKESLAELNNTISYFREFF